VVHQLVVVPWLVEHLEVAVLVEAAEEHHLAHLLVKQLSY